MWQGHVSLCEASTLLLKMVCKHSGTEEDQLLEFLEWMLSHSGLMEVSSCSTVLGLCWMWAYVVLKLVYTVVHWWCFSRCVKLTIPEALIHPHIIREAGFGLYADNRQDGLSSLVQRMQYLWFSKRILNLEVNFVFHFVSVHFIFLLFDGGVYGWCSLVAFAG